MNTNPYRQKILKTILHLGRVHAIWDVFSDFAELGSLRIANSVRRKTEEWEKRETRYLETIGRYRQEERKLFPEMFADLVQALEYELTRMNAPADVLGVLFHELGLHDKYKGQFFTPQSICDMMGAIALGDNGSALNEEGRISPAEPCCGSGAMVLGFAKAMFDAGLNYCTQLAITAADTDIKCVYMTYLQLSLYGIPAVVIHGNTLTSDEWARWYTPTYNLRGWRRPG
jgi:type I restriction-modification system DNA methylase subunit